jgi:antimicrobial peptide system SdpA family protein
MPSEEGSDSKGRLREAWALRGLGAHLLGMFGAWIALAAYAIHASMPFNPITLPFEAEHKTALIEVLPEGWRFFTRNPQEEQVIPLVLIDGTWRPASAPSSSARNLFGLNRAGRAQSVELGLLLEQMQPKDRWAPCDGSPAECLSRAPVATHLANPSRAPTMCGDMGFVAQRPVPWAWSANRNLEMPAKVVRVAVKC